MKLSLLRGTAYNACDHIASYPFQFSDLKNVPLPKKGTLIIDLKNNRARRGRATTKLPFTADMHRWFLRELTHAKIPPASVRSALVTMTFQSGKSPRVACTISAGGKTFKHARSFSLW